MNLDAIVDATPHAQQTRTVAVAPVGVTVPHETAATTYAALAEHYDGRRDNAMQGAAKVLSGYSAEMDKRTMTAAIAAPFLAELRRYLDSAEKLNKSATINQQLHNAAK